MARYPYGGPKRKFKRYTAFVSFMHFFFRCIFFLIFPILHIDSSHFSRLSHLPAASGFNMGAGPEPEGAYGKTALYQSTGMPSGQTRSNINMPRDVPLNGIFSASRQKGLQSIWRFQHPAQCGWDLEFRYRKTLLKVNNGFWNTLGHSEIPKLRVR